MRRNQTRDYVDVAALSSRYGRGPSARVLDGIDDYYSDQHRDSAGSDARAGLGVASQLVRQLADPRPADASVTRELDSYRNLAAEWTDWKHVRSVCAALATAILEQGGQD